MIRNRYDYMVIRGSLRQPSACCCHRDDCLSGCLQPSGGRSGVAVVYLASFITFSNSASILPVILTKIYIFLNLVYITCAKGCNTYYLSLTVDIILIIILNESISKLWNYENVDNNISNNNNFNLLYDQWNSLFVNITSFSRKLLIARWFCYYRHKIIKRSRSKLI